MGETASEASSSAAHSRRTRSAGAACRAASTVAASTPRRQSTREERGQRRPVGHGGRVQLGLELEEASRDRRDASARTASRDR